MYVAVGKTHAKLSMLTWVDGHSQKLDTHVKDTFEDLKPILYLISGPRHMGFHRYCTFVAACYFGQGLYLHRVFAVFLLAVGGTAMNTLLRTKPTAQTQLFH